jgi:CDP-glucose 4,6-dehydratase
MNFSNFKNKTVLITGHTGFKGLWLTTTLLSLGSKIVGISLKPNSYQKKVLKKLGSKKIKNYFFDIYDHIKLKKILIQNQPDYVFHLAAQPIVSTSYKKPLFTWKTNVIGTGNLLESLRFLKKKCSIIIVTSDKCYEVKNQKKITFLKETDPLGGKDPYSASKASTEIIYKSYYHSYLKKKKNISITSVRAGNIIGGGDWSENRIIPDCVKNWVKKKKLHIRNPNYIRPWQHVLDAINGYLLLAKTISETKKFNGESFNFGPEKNSIKTVQQLCEIFQSYWFGPSKIYFKNKKQFSETKTLALSIVKAKNLLGWKPLMNLNKSLNLTANWYQKYYKNFDVVDIYFDQIKFFKNLCKIKK